jgi:hypothetical protein
MIVIEQIPPNTMAQGAMAGANRCLTFDSS